MRKWILPPTFGVAFIVFSALIYNKIAGMADPTTNYAVIPYILGAIGILAIVDFLITSFLYAKTIRKDNKKLLFVAYNSVMSALPATLLSAPKLRLTVFAVIFIYVCGLTFLGTKIFKSGTTNL